MMISNRKTLWSPWVIRKYFSALRVNALFYLNFSGLRDKYKTPKDDISTSRDMQINDANVIIHRIFFFKYHIKQEMKYNCKLILLVSNMLSLTR